MLMSTLSRRPLPSTPDSPSSRSSQPGASPVSASERHSSPAPASTSAAPVGQETDQRPGSLPDSSRRSSVLSDSARGANVNINGNGYFEHLSESSPNLLGPSHVPATPNLGSGSADGRDLLAANTQKAASSANVIDAGAIPANYAAADSEQRDLPSVAITSSGELTSASSERPTSSTAPPTSTATSSSSSSGFFNVGSRIARVMVQPINLMVNLASPSTTTAPTANSPTIAAPVPPSSTMTATAAASLPTPTDSRQPSQAVSPDLSSSELSPEPSMTAQQDPQSPATNTTAAHVDQPLQPRPSIQTTTAAPVPSDQDTLDPNSLSPRPRSISAAATAASSSPSRQPDKQARPRSSTMAAPSNTRTNYGPTLSPFPTLHESASTPTPNSAPAASSSSSTLPGPPDIPLVAKHSKNHAFHAIFKHLPLDEFLIEDFSCALQKEILVQGRLYLTERHICFHAVIFGWVTSVQIPLADVTLIEKRVTALIFPNAIEVHTHTQRYFFASFIFRELAFNLMCSLWHKARGEAGEMCLPFHPDRPHGTIEGAAAAAESKKGKGRRSRSQSRKRLFTFGSSSRNTSASSSSAGLMDGNGGSGKGLLGGSKLGLGAGGESTSNTDSASDAGRPSMHGVARRRTGGSASGRRSVVSASGAASDDGDESDDEGDRQGEGEEDDDDSGWDLQDDDDGDDVHEVHAHLPPPKRKKSAATSPAKASPARSAPKHKVVTNILNEEAASALGMTPMQGTHPRSLSESSIHASPAVVVAAQSLRNAASSDLLSSPRIAAASIPLPPSRASTPASATVPAPAADAEPAVKLPPIGSCSCSHHPEVVLDTEWPNVLPEQSFEFLYTPGAPIIDLVIKGKMNCSDLDFGPWDPAAPPSTSLPPTSAARALTYNMPLNLPVPVPGAPKVTGVKSRESMVDSSPSHFAVAAVTETPDVPSGTSFAIHAHICMTHAGQGATRVKVSVAVKWSKSVWMLKSTIENGAIDGQKKYWMQVDEAIRAQFGKAASAAAAAVASPAKPVRRRTRSGSGTSSALGMGKSSGSAKLPRASGKTDLAAAGDGAGPVRRGSGHHRASGKRSSKSGPVSKGRDAGAPPARAATSSVDRLHLGLLIALVFLNLVVFWQLRAMHGSVTRAQQQASLGVTWTAVAPSPTTTKALPTPSAIDPAPSSAAATPTSSSKVTVAIATVETGIPPAPVPVPVASKDVPNIERPEAASNEKAEL